MAAIKLLPMLQCLLINDGALIRAELQWCPNSRHMARLLHDHAIVPHTEQHVARSEAAVSHLNH